MALMSKLSSGALLRALAERPRDMDAEDLVDREAIECANRAVLFVLEGGRIVDATPERGAGVECIGSNDSSSRLVSSIAVGISPELSKAGREGKDGISRPSTSLMRCQTLSGVSSRAAMQRV